MLAAARAEIDRSPEELPPILDPFAERWGDPAGGAAARARRGRGRSEPVALLINKAMIEIPPLFAGRPAVHPEVDATLMAWERAQGYEIAEQRRFLSVSKHASWGVVISELGSRDLLSTVVIGRGAATSAAPPSRVSKGPRRGMRETRSGLLSAALCEVWTILALISEWRESSSVAEAWWALIVETVPSACLPLS